MEHIVTYEDVDDKDEVYILMYKNIEGKTIKGSGYIAYIPELKLFGLETYFTEKHSDWFTHRYKTEKMGNDELGIISNDIELDEYVCDDLSMPNSIARSYAAFLKSFSSEEELLKTLDRAIIEHQL